MLGAVVGTSHCLQNVRWATPGYDIPASLGRAAVVFPQGGLRRTPVSPKANIYVVVHLSVVGLERIESRRCGIGHGPSSLCLVEEN